MPTLLIQSSPKSISAQSTKPKRRSPANKIVAKFTAEQLAAHEDACREAGFNTANSALRSERAELERQRAQLGLEQVKAVTDLIRATTENLSKAGYLIGKLNKDNSR